MDLLINTHIDFMKYRKVFVWGSVVLSIVAAVAIFRPGGLNLGIDFAGGTSITVRLRDAVETDDLRRAMEDAGLGAAQIQRFSGGEGKEFLIKTPTVPGKESGNQEAILAALDASLDPNASGLDLNRAGVDSIAGLLGGIEGDGSAELAAAIAAKRDAVGLLTSWDEVAAVEGVDAATVAKLKERSHLGAFRVLQVENVGPQIGSELRTKGILASVLSLAAMLVYIWLRFELRFGVGALVATFHDVWITLGLYALMGFEFNLATIAAFLTLVGYSVNDTVVIFDRVRENLRKRRRLPLVQLINDSLNQTLSRTLLTGSTTLLAVGALLVYGGEVLRGFSFVILVGVLIGTYSSIYIASPFTLLWEQYVSPYFAKGKRPARQEPTAA